ncbi:unnamed protein product [Rotaria sp. Silwood2]|nr:unnamed protein product [Rotaria sp. Silwood2]CAF2977159.1 unnamed protein product [Rotaria sp. Silwood2]
MGEFHKVKQYYNRILAESSIVDLRTTNCYFELDNVAIEQDGYSDALAYHPKVLDAKQNFLDEENANVAFSYNQIGATYRRLGIYDQALEYTSIGLKLRLKCLDSNDVDLPQSYRDIGLVYYRLSEKNLVLINFTKAHEIYVKALLENHPDIGVISKALGGVFYEKGDFNTALHYFSQALTIFRKSLPPSHTFTKGADVMIERAQFMLLITPQQAD